MWKCFAKPPRGLDAAIAETGTFIREQLGDHKCYASDSDGTRAKPFDFVRR